jgi:impB/mucB/samB family C-terminal domain
VRTVEMDLLRGTVGSLADWLRQLANGIDDRPVVPNREAKSSGSENTYPEDLTDLDTIRTEIAEMASHSIAWLARRQRLARTVTIKVRYSDFTTITRSHTAEATRDPSDLTARAVRLLEKTDAGRRPVRLLGVSLHNFTAEPEVDGTALPFGGTEDTKETKDTEDPQGNRAVCKRAALCVLCSRWCPCQAPGHHFTSLRAIAPGGSGNELGSSAPFTGGRSWNMKSHFQRSDGFDACSQCRASSGRLNDSVVNPSKAFVPGWRAAMSARTWAALV